MGPGGWGVSRCVSEARERCGVVLWRGMNSEPEPLQSAFSRGLYLEGGGRCGRTGSGDGDGDDWSGLGLGLGLSGDKGNLLFMSRGLRLKGAAW